MKAHHGSRKEASTESVDQVVATSGVEFVVEHPDEERTAALLVRTGVVGHVAQFSVADSREFRRGDRVLCRTGRGIEVGEVLRVSETSASELRPILRRMNESDLHLWRHLQRLAQDAFEACSGWLTENGQSRQLVDVEPLFDGKTLFFHFLPMDGSEGQEETDAYVASLAAVYEQTVRDSEFAKLVESGCGPDCGTEKASGQCGSAGGCATCSVSSACKR